MLYFLSSKSFSFQPLSLCIPPLANTPSKGLLLSEKARNYSPTLRRKEPTPRREILLWLEVSFISFPYWDLFPTLPCYQAHHQQEALDNKLNPHSDQKLRDPRQPDIIYRCGFLQSIRSTTTITKQLIPFFGVFYFKSRRTRHCWGLHSRMPLLLFSSCPKKSKGRTLLNWPLQFRKDNSPFSLHKAPKSHALVL